MKCKTTSHTVRSKVLKKHPPSFTVHHVIVTCQKKKVGRMHIAGCKNHQPLNYDNVANTVGTT